MNTLNAPRVVGWLLGLFCLVGPRLAWAGGNGEEVVCFFKLLGGGAGVLATFLIFIGALMLVAHRTQRVLSMTALSSLFAGFWGICTHWCFKNLFNPAYWYLFDYDAMMRGSDDNWHPRPLLYYWLDALCATLVLFAAWRTWYQRRQRRLRAAEIEASLHWPPTA